MREFIKALLRGVALLVVAPILLWYFAWSLILGHDRMVESCSQALALVPGLSGQYLRRAFLARTLAECGDSAVIGFGTVFSRTGARIGARAYIGPLCTIGLAHIKDDALVAAGVHIPSGPRTHGIDPSIPIRDQRGDARLVTIGRGAWIGNNAVVMADVGDGTIVGAGAVVTSPIPDRVIAAGVPARVVRARGDDETL
jgi:virginiamycin A acetyltransferase